MNRLTELIREDMKPALGVTEPGAIACGGKGEKLHKWCGAVCYCETEQWNV